MRKSIDGLALAWVVPFVLSTLTMCVGYVYKDSFVAASQMLICVAAAGMTGSFAWGVWQIRQDQQRSRRVRAESGATLLRAESPGGASPHTPQGGQTGAP
jgi:hypothetical protein